MCLAPFRVRQLPLVPVSFRSVKLGHFDSHSCIVVVQWTHRGFRRWWGSWPTTAAVTTLYRHYPPPLSPVEHFLGLSVVPSSLVRNTFNSIKALCIFVITGLEVFWKSGGTRGLPATKNKNVCVWGPVLYNKNSGVWVPRAPLVYLRTAHGVPKSENFWNWVLAWESFCCCLRGNGQSCFKKMVRRGVCTSVLQWNVAPMWMCIISPASLCECSVQRKNIAVPGDNIVVTAIHCVHFKFLLNR